MKDEQKIFIDIFRKNAGNIAVTCRKLNMSRNTFYLWYNENQVKIDGNGSEGQSENEFKAAVDEVKESLIDFTESALYKKISGITTKNIKVKEVLDKDGKKVRLIEEQTINHAPDIAAIIFLLKTLGRKRGWKEIYDSKIETDVENKLTKEQLALMDKLPAEDKKELIRISKKFMDN